VVNAYALAFGGLLLLGGRAGDLLGRRKMFITGLLLFPPPPGPAGSPPPRAGCWPRAPSRASVARSPPRPRCRWSPPPSPKVRRATGAMGVYAAMSVAGDAIGLLAGGLLTTYASWRWVLFVNVPIGAGEVDAERAG